MVRERFMTRDPGEVFQRWWPLFVLSAFHFALLAPAILSLSWWSAPWLFLGSLAFIRLQTLPCFAKWYGPIVCLDERGITAEQGFLGDQWTLPWSEYAGYRDEPAGPGNMPFWGLARLRGIETRVLTILSRRHGVYGRLPIEFPLGASQENYRRLLEALERYTPR